MISRDQLMLESIVYWTKDVQRQISEFQPKLEMNFLCLKSELKERLKKGLFASVNPLYSGVVESTRLRWAYFDCQISLYLGKDKFQVQCITESQYDYPRIIKTFDANEVVMMQSSDSREKMITLIIQEERDLYEAHKEKLRKQHKEAVKRLREELEKMESEII